MAEDGFPKEGLFRSAPSLELRDDAASSMPRLTGYMLRFDEPTEIDSLFEGRFIERISPGAAKKTLAENSGLRILFQHGKDPSIGEKALAPPDLIEDSRGVRYDEPELFDTAYNRDLIPGLRANQYGSSFRFSVLNEKVDEHPEESEDNPDRLPERTITEFKLYEGGPVTFPAYSGATAGVRSLTDEFRRYSLEEAEILFERWTKERGLIVPEERISDAPWDGAASRFSDAQYQAACAIDRKVCGGDMMDAPPKTRCSLPYKEPGGEINRNGVHAAAARINQVQACPEAIAAGKAKLRAAYKAMGEEPPDSLSPRSEDDSGAITSTSQHSPGAGQLHSKASRAIETPIGGKPPKRPLEQSLRQE